MSDHPRDVILLEVEAERHRQDARWGQQNHKDGTHENWSDWADLVRAQCEEGDDPTWLKILREEFAEVSAEARPVHLREELIQVAAVAVAWVEAIDRRQS